MTLKVGRGPRHDEACPSTASGLARRLGVGLVCALSVLSAATARAELRLTEVLFNGTGAADNDEFIEITNVGTDAIDLSTYRIGDEETVGGGEGFHTFPASTLQPGESCIVTRDAPSFAAAFTVPSGTKIFALSNALPGFGLTRDTALGTGNLNLGNTGDEVLLLKRLSPGVYTLVDGLSYLDGVTSYSPPGGVATAFMDLAIAPAGLELQSLGRKSARKDTDKRSDWRVLTVPTPGQVPFTICGDGTLEAGEGCDDGNDLAGDGCGETCLVECGFTCEGTGPLSCLESCGDGDVAGLEECDDGNDLPGDGCDALCRIEPGFVCPDPAPRCDGQLATRSTCALDPCLLPLRVTEVHADGLLDPTSEWIELTNTGLLPVDLAPWSVGDQAVEGATGEGMVGFPDGATLAPGEVIIVANDGARFAAEWSFIPAYELSDSASAATWLTRTSDWAPNQTIALANDADEVVLACGGELRDVVRWGIASQSTIGAPTSNYSAATPQVGPLTFERISREASSGTAADWSVSRCPSPGQAPNPNHPPETAAGLVIAPPGVQTTFAVSASDLDGDALSCAVDTTGLVGTLDNLGGGLFRYTPPAGPGPLTTGFRFTAADACATSTPTTIEVQVVAASCDPGLADLRITEVHVDARVDNDGEWIELTNTGANAIDLGFLEVGDEATTGVTPGREGLGILRPGTTLGPGQAMVLAFSARAFKYDWRKSADLEWYRDSDGVENELPRAAQSASGAIRLDNAGDEVVLIGCDGEVIDALYWGQAAAPTQGRAPIEVPWSSRLHAPPAWDGLSSAGPTSFERREPTVDTDSAADWFLSTCPSPGIPRGANDAPVALEAAYPVALGATLSASFGATDPDSGALTFTATATSGVLTVVDASSGAFTWQAPAVAGIYTIDFAVSDGCATTTGVVQICVGSSEVAGNALDEDCDGVALCYQDLDGDGFGSATLVPDPTLGGCVGPGLAAVGGDCDDLPSGCGAACAPGRAELCDGQDNDCDALSVDGSGDPGVGLACDAAADPNLCADDLVQCVSGTLSCVDRPDGDAQRVESCDPLQLDEDCNGKADDLDTAPLGRTTFFEDRDADGYGSGVTRLACRRPPGYAEIGGDCDDDPALCGAGCYPGRVESRVAGNCTDTRDNDCDGQSDSDAECFADRTCYLDQDGDGFGSTTSVVLTGANAGAGCAAYADGTRPVGSWVESSGDCDDRPAFCGAACRPGLPELCDGYDNDCLAQTADGIGDVRIGVACDSTADADLCKDEVTVCSAGAVACPNNAAGDAARVEVCDPLDVDEDCDGGADDLDPQDNATGKLVFYPDLDGDGRGRDAGAVTRCDAPPNHTNVGGDCDDDPALCGAACRPGLVESRGQGNCGDGKDNDCDGASDADPECFGDILCYLDRDGDGFGRFPTETVVSGPVADLGCAGYADGINPVGSWVGNGLDCDDDPLSCGAACYPGALERCDGKDNDCSAQTADGAGDPAIGAGCDAAEDSDLCVDDRASCQGGRISCVNIPAGDAAQVERCDDQGADEDCDGGANDADPDGPPADAPLWYRDEDGDGFGTPGEVRRRCVKPVGFVDNALDCDDRPSACGVACHPGAPELCDGYDNDCSAGTPDGAADAAVGTACDAPTDADECPDDVVVCAAGQIRCDNNPSGDAARVEVCDAVHADEDCDGFADDADLDGALGAETFYADKDGDGHGDAATAVSACAAPAGHVTSADDCDDDPLGCGAACHPGRVEDAASGLCADGFDNDCDGATDEAAACAVAATCYRDEDRDGHGDLATASTVDGSALPAGGCAAWDDGVHAVGSWSALSDDCDDNEASAYPGATETVGNEVDEDCDGIVRCWVDNDNDNYAAAGAAEADAPTGQSCAEAFELAARAGDCDDDLSACGASCSPVAVELCDERDNDCDSQTDEGAVCAETPVGVLGGGESCAGGGVSLGLGAVLSLLALCTLRGRRAR